MSAPVLRSAASVAAERPLSVGEALGILRDAAQALAALHAAGAAHGAVCAENIVLDERWAARLCRDTPAPPRLSPEQERGARPDARSDVYGLGAAMADLLGIEAPRGSAREGGVPEPILRLLATMTADDPEDRYQTMGEVLTALEACELLTGQSAVRRGGERRPMKPHWRLCLAVAALGLLEPLLERAVPLPPKAKAPGRR